jgi:hypothetical protein
MKKILFIALGAMAITSCQKNSTVTPVVTQPYLSVTANSTWNYELVDSVALTTTPYTLTSTNRDSVVNGKSFHVFTNSAGPNEYYNLTDKQYFSFERPPSPMDLGNRIVYLYLLEETQGTGWSQSHMVSFYPGQELLATFNNSIAEKGISKTVNNKAYTDVIRVNTIISVAGLSAGSFTGTISAYFAPKVGMIQKDSKIRWMTPPPSPGNPPGVLVRNMHTKLMSSVIL